MQGEILIEDSQLNIDEAVKAAANVDYILLCIGENSYTETPGNINDLNLSDNQIDIGKCDDQNRQAGYFNFE